MFKIKLPNDKTYLEKGLPEYLELSISTMKSCWERLERGERDFREDTYWDELYSSINSAEVSQAISAEQANHLREKYLRMEVEETV